jgi:hypothetical protein
MRRAFVAERVAQNFGLVAGPGSVGSCQPDLVKVRLSAQIFNFVVGLLAGNRVSDDVGDSVTPARSATKQLPLIETSQCAHRLGKLE